jgi:YdjC-like protein
MAQKNAIIGALPFTCEIHLNDKMTSSRSWIEVKNLQTGRIFNELKSNVFHMVKLLIAVFAAMTISMGGMHAQGTNAPRLIVRGDDMGFSHSGNVALTKAYKEGIETSIEIIVPSPWFPEAVRMLRENPGIDVGVHLTLTSEWDNIKWRPVSDCPSITDEDGYFFPFIWPNKNYPGRALSENNWKIGDIEKEFRAQIELAMKRIPRISHISAHMGCSAISDEVKPW